MLTLSALPLAIAASLAAPAQGAAQPTIQPLHAMAIKAKTAEAIPSPKLTEMRVVVDAAGNSHMVCNVVPNPAYKQALRNAVKQAGADQ